MFTKLLISNIISTMVEIMPSGRITDKQVIREALAPLRWTWRLGPIKELREQASALAAYRAAESFGSRFIPARTREDPDSIWGIFLRRLETRAGY